MIENQRSSGINQVREENSLDREFFNRWIRRKHENSLGRGVLIDRELHSTKQTGSASRFSRLLHRLEVNPKELARSHRTGHAVLGGELRINHEPGSSTENSEKELDNREEAIFDIRHEALDSASYAAKPVTSDLSDGKEGETVSASAQIPTALSSILADKSYTQAKEPTVPIAEPSPTPLEMLKDHKAYIIYGFLAGITAIVVVVVFSLAR